jgi:hypothetical protein
MRLAERKMIEKLNYLRNRKQALVASAHCQCMYTGSAGVGILTSHSRALGVT